MSGQNKSGRKTATIATLSPRRMAEERFKSDPAPTELEATEQGASASEAAAPAALDPVTVFREAAQGRALAALEVLADLMKTASSDAVRASAANSVIDRAHGRAAPAVRVVGSGGEDGEGVELSVTWLSPEKS